MSSRPGLIETMYSIYMKPRLVSLLFTYPFPVKIKSKSLTNLSVPKSYSSHIKLFLNMVLADETTCSTLWSIEPNADSNNIYVIERASIY